MLEFLSPHSDVDAINLLKADHDTVKDLFEQFEKSHSRAEKKKLVAKALMELKIHAAIEEDIFYPAVRRKTDEESLMDEADEEHHVAKVLIAELDEMDGAEDHFDAKFHVLSESVRHHIKEEEGKMFPEARGLDIDYDALGRKLFDRKKELKKDGVPATAEAKMISKAGAPDSPARAAKSHASKNSGARRHTRISLRKNKVKSSSASHAKRRKAA